MVHAPTDQKVAGSNPAECTADQAPAGLSGRGFRRALQQRSPATARATEASGPPLTLDHRVVRVIEP